MAAGIDLASVGAIRYRAVMNQLAHVALLVRDYDEAIAFYVKKLGFILQEDTPMNAGKRWVVIRPPGSAAGATSILLARASNEEQARSIGNQAGGRVFLFLATDDFARDYAAMQSAGVHFVRPPSHEKYGTVAVWEDLYGNRWDLVQYHPAPAPARD